MPREARADFGCHEWALLGLLLLTALALFGAGSVALGAEALALLVVHIVAIERARQHAPKYAERLRLGFAYGTTLWFYMAVRRLVPALGLETCDPTLRAIDEALFGTMPAVASRALARPWLTELMSVCYLSYQLYLHGVLIHALWLDDPRVRRLARHLFCAFAFGLSGYLLVPAVGPQKAFPELFSAALSGGVFTRINDAIVTSGSSLYDVFPSLHLLITSTLLAHDWREHRRRFFVLILPACGLFASTLYLGYHYATDLVAGAALLGLIEAAFYARRRYAANHKGSLNSARAD